MPSDQPRPLTRIEIRRIFDALRPVREALNHPINRASNEYVTLTKQLWEVVVATPAREWDDRPEIYDGLPKKLREPMQQTIYLVLWGGINDPADGDPRKRKALPEDLDDLLGKRGDPPKKRGRPPHTDPKKDKRIVEAWATGEYETRRDLERELGLPPGHVERAQDRHRKRKKK
jgi:hypothetical protein